MWYWLEMLEQKMFSINELEEIWEDWIHYDRQWKEYLLKDMTDSHLRNTIKYFWEIYNVKPLINELQRRKILNDKNK